MEAVKNIGRIQLESMKEKGEGLLEVFTEDVSGGGAYKNCFEIIVELKQGKYCYGGINYSQYDSSYKEKYLYRSGSSRGADITPTAKITDIDKTFSNKILKGLKDALDFKPKGYEDEKKVIESMYNVINENMQVILKDLKDKLKDIPKKEGSFLTVSLIESKAKKYIGDFELFKDKIVSDAFKKFHYSETYKKDVRKQKAVCSLCTKDVDEVYGLVGVFPFYTIDKPGYISGGFNYEKAWRNFPVCKDCSIQLELGKKYLDENLSFSFYGRRYYLIPRPIFEKSLEGILKKYISLKSEEPSEVRQKYSGTEERVMRFIGKEKNFISFDIMFFEKNNAALNILLNIEDISPSRFKNIFNTLDDIRSMEFFADKPVGFELLNNVFPRDIYNRYFLNIIDKIVSNTKVEYRFLMQFFNGYIVDAFKRYECDEFPKDKDSFHTATFRVFGFLYFLRCLDQFKERKEEKVKMTMKNKDWDIKDYDTIENMFEAFFDESAPFFDIPDKKVAFLTGYLAKKLLNIQYAKEQRKPFTPRLKSLKLNSKDIKRLIPEIQGKLVEYKSEFYNEEFRLLSNYMIESRELNRLSDLDIPFYFSLGMNMDKNFKTSIKDDVSFNNEDQLK